MSEIACSLCGAKTDSEQEGQYEYVVWDDYETKRTGVFISEGLDHEAGYGWIATRAYCICTKCFVKKLEPWLVSQGATPRTSAGEW